MIGELDECYSWLYWIACDKFAFVFLRFVILQIFSSHLACKCFPVIWIEEVFMSFGLQMFSCDLGLQMLPCDLIYISFPVILFTDIFCFLLFDSQTPVLRRKKESQQGVSSVMIQSATLWMLSPWAT